MPAVVRAREHAISVAWSSLPSAGTRVTAVEVAAGDNIGVVLVLVLLGLVALLLANGDDGAGDGAGDGDGDGDVAADDARGGVASTAVAADAGPAPAGVASSPEGCADDDCGSGTVAVGPATSACF